METEYHGRKNGKVGIEVIDDNESRHTVTVGLDDGGIIFHGNDDYPHKPAERTEEEELIMSQVEARAKYAAQQEFPEEYIRPFEWLPEELERVLAAIENQPADAFERDFRGFYEAIQDPPVDRPQEDVIVLTIGLSITEDDRIEQVSDAVVPIVDVGSGTEAAGPDPAFTPQLVLYSNPLDFAWPFEERFREFLLNNVKCQIRDAYLHMGERPPQEYQVEGFGKLRFLGMEQYEDIRFPYDEA